MIDFIVKIFIKDYKNVSDGAVREKYGILAGVMGIILNVLLFILKLICGILTASIAIMADALNNLTDAGSSVISMVGFKLANKPVDKEHPFGHGRMEYLSGLLVSIVIILVGFELIQSSFEKIFNPTQTNMQTVVFIILGVSVLIKLWMFFYNRKLGNRINSAGMKATAIDSVSDCVATLVVLISGIIAKTTNLSIDGYVGLLVAVFILFAGVRSAKETIDVLLGQAPNPELMHEISDFVTSFDIVVGVHDFIFHNYGVGRELLSLHAEVPCDKDVLYIHEEIDKIEGQIWEKFGVNAVIHMDPIEVNDQFVSEARQTVLLALSKVYKDVTIHDFRMVRGEGRTNLIFDAVVPHEVKDSEEEIKKNIFKAVQMENEKYHCVIKIDRPFC